MNSLTAEQIINYVLTELDPALATKLTNGDQAKKCTTPVYDSITTPNGVVELERRIDPKTGMRKYVAIYVRVSTEKQS
jgi:hypothetical protein